MAHNEFEHIVQGRFQGFESTPPEAVWTSINSVRNRRKKRMIILWWVLPLTTAACLGMGIYFGTGSSGRSNAKSTSTETASKELLKTDKQDNNTNKGVAPNKSSDEINGASKEIKQTISVPSNKQLTEIGPNGNSPKERPISTTPRVKEITQVPPQLTSTPSMTSAPDLISRPLQPFGINTASLTLCQAYGNGEYINYHSHAIGIRMGGFVPIFQQKSNAGSFTGTEPNTDPALVASTNYTRFAEVTPYYEFTKTTSRLRFQGFALYAASNMNLSNYSGKGQSIGLGSGTSFAIVKRRFSTHLYANLQSELGFNRFSSLDENETTLSGGGTMTTNANGVAPASYRQFSLAGEAGIRFSYILNRPRWSINASAGYRNYFWQQKVEGPAVIRTPDLLHWNAGIRFTL
ncbi:MAG: hypothetical protein Crog4KO_00430 [Crocinitomicaceae bacterium]